MKTTLLLPRICERLGQRVSTQSYWCFRAHAISEVHRVISVIVQGLSTHSVHYIMEGIHTSRPILIPAERLNQVSHMLVNSIVFITAIDRPAHQGLIRIAAVDNLSHQPHDYFICIIYRDILLLRPASGVTVMISGVMNRQTGRDYGASMKST